MKGLRAILAALYSARTALESFREESLESGSDAVAEFMPDLSRDFRQRLEEISTRAEEIMMAAPRLEDEDRRLLEEIVESSRRMQWLTDTLTVFHPAFTASAPDAASDIAALTRPAGRLRVTPPLETGAVWQQHARGFRSDSVRYASWNEVEPLLTQEATSDLMGATLRGDRMAMRDALDVLAALVPGEDRRSALVTFVRHLIALAGWLRRAAPEELENAIDVVEQLPGDALEGYAHKFAWLAYAAGTSDADASVN